MNEFLKSLFLASLFVHGQVVLCAVTQKSKPTNPLSLPDFAPRANVGWVEHATIILTDTTGKKHAIPVEAKVDTGARTSSLHAFEAKTLEKDGREFVRFTFSSGNKKLEAQYAVIKEKSVKSSDGDGEERQFIEVEICIGNSKERILVSLNDRGSMRYPLLLGRRFLEKKFLVDSGSKLLLGKPNCK